MLGEETWDDTAPAHQPKFFASKSGVDCVLVGASSLSNTVVVVDKDESEAP